MGRPVVWTTYDCARCGATVTTKPSIAIHRKYCSRACWAATQKGVSKPESVGNNYAFRGDNVTKWAYHKRANKMKPPGPCERCDGDGEVVHHRDHDPSHNVLDNLERLCRPCHASHHHGAGA